MDGFCVLVHGVNERGEHTIAGGVGDRSTELGVAGGRFRHPEQSSLSDVQLCASRSDRLYEQPFHPATVRSRGALSSKIHQLVDGRGRPLAVPVGPGQANWDP